MGENMVGALFGALFQSVTFITGGKALLAIVASLSFLSMICLLDQLKQEQVPISSVSEEVKEPNHGV